MNPNLQMSKIKEINSFNPPAIDKSKEEQFANIFLETISAMEGLFDHQNGTFRKTLNETNEQAPYERKPLVFIIFFSFLLFSNLFTYMMRIYKSSISTTNINIIVIMNSYIVELYGLIVTSIVSSNNIQCILEIIVAISSVYQLCG